jgi:hypothetical protein
MAMHVIDTCSAGNLKQFFSGKRKRVGKKLYCGSSLVAHTSVTKTTFIVLHLSWPTLFQACANAMGLDSAAKENFSPR